ncbi:hypothetical protein LVD15_12050 [Fulvivirga maritima]|uniref:hypothetical protein n=1 Tax=Fulvivirga maritima TaxID=2904247 RepID=UPI001F27646E|nr:hypothetical protein [Fulvivirga maritima]UII29127.1 hypothetical protein LVD15_12050 [Fulvivirga maritima]
MKKKILGKGYFGAVFLEVKFWNDTFSNLEINFSNSEYKEFVSSGINYFHECLKRNNIKDSLVVNVKGVKCMPVDTTGIVIMFTTIMALSSGLGKEIDGLNLNTQNGLFEIPSNPSLSLVLPS